MNDVFTKLKFQRRPAPVIAEHRPMYKIAQILLILHIASRAGRSKLPRLHLFNWALKAADRTKQLIDAASQRKLRVAAWGFDPALAIAVRYAIADELIRETQTGYEITDNGTEFAKAICKLSDLFATDKKALERIGKGITENMVEEIAKGWENT